MSPGPNGALLLKTVPASGKKHGYWNVVGIVTAFYLHGTISVLGLSAIIVSSAHLYFAVKIIGALYLAYLGINALISALRRTGISSGSTSVKVLVTEKSLVTSFFEGLLTNLLNPKVSIFYLAAFPQFIDFQQGAIAVSYGLITIHAVFSAVWFSSLVLLIGRSTSFLKSKQFSTVLQSATGTLLLWFSYQLAKAK